jgi:predicted dehydrogenase
VLKQLGVLGLVIDTNARVRSSITDEFGIPTSSSINELSQFPNITAAVVATPAESHTNVASQCLELGLDLLVEKPLALTAADAMGLCESADASNRILMVGHLLLFHPAVEALHSLVQSGELGEIRYIYSNRLNLGRVRQTENILWSFAPHDIAIILHLLDALPEDIEAVGGSWIQPGIDDITVTHLSFSGGQKAHIFVSWLHPYKEHKLVVVGSQKMAVFDDLSTTAKLVVRDVGVDVGAEGIPLERRGQDHAVTLAETEPLLAELQHFLRCCETREQPLTDGPHAVDVLRVLEDAQGSLNRTDMLRR